MPKAKTRSSISPNLLKPQSNPEKLPVRLLRWLLSSGRYIFIFVEAVVLIAFGARFKLDADLASKKEAIEAQIPFIESLKPYEILIRQTQLKLSAISNIKKTNIDWPIILKKIADQAPSGLKINTLNLEKNVASATISINGEAQTNNDLSTFVAGLKEDNTFSKVNLVSVSLESEIIKFTVEATATGINPEEKIYEK